MYKVCVIWYAALMSFFIGLFGVFVTDYKAVIENGFFSGYRPIVFVVIILQVSKVYTCM